MRQGIRNKPVAASFEVSDIPVGEIVANPRNARRHPQEQIARLAKSIKRFGQARPVLVRKANRMIIAGHGVTEACRAAGLATVKVLLWDCDQATADAYMLGDNRFGELSRDDPAAVKALLRDFGIGDPESIGYNAAEVDELLEQSAADVTVTEIPVSDLKDDHFWISIRGPLIHQAAVLQILTKATADVEGVSVELGTITVGP